MNGVRSKRLSTQDIVTLHHRDQVAPNPVHSFSGYEATWRYIDGSLGFGLLAISRKSVISLARGCERVGDVSPATAMTSCESVAVLLWRPGRVASSV